MLGPYTARSLVHDVQVVPVLVVRWAHRTWYLSVRELTGTGFHADPGLMEFPEIGDEISLESGGDIGSSTSLAFVLPALDVSEYVAAGHDIESMTLELSIVWHKGGTLVHAWSAREVRAEGDAGTPQHDDPGQPAGYVSCTLEDSPYRVAHPIGRRTWEVSPETYPNSPAQGDRVPLVLGAPDPAATGTGPPAPVIAQNGTPQNTDLAISMGWCSASTVTIVDSNGLNEDFPIGYAADDLGQVTAVVDISGAAVISIADGVTYTSSWGNGPAQAPFGGYGPLHLAAYMLFLGGADIDGPEWIRCAQMIRLPAGGYSDDPDTEAWEVARDILSGLPVSMRRGRNGWAPVITDPYLAPRLFTATWRTDGPTRRNSAWTAAGESRVTRVEVMAGDTGVLVGSTADRDAPLPHAWARQLKRQQEASQTAAWSWDPSLGYRIAIWTARIQALGWEVASYDVPAQFGGPVAGDWVYLADDDRYAIVTRRTLSGGVWDYSLARPRGR